MEKARVAREINNETTPLSLASQLWGYHVVYRSRITVLERSTFSDVEAAEEETENVLQTFCSSLGVWKPQSEKL